MSISRKEFLKKSMMAAAGLTLPGALSRFTPGSETITILYTNDTHARLDPFPENATQFAGLGGIARRANLVKKIRKSRENVLLLDAGDVFQGTPWFDVYGGEVDLKLMGEMRYDAMAVGNHEFDNGPDGFADAAKKAGFPILAANYHVAGTPMNEYVRRFIIRETGGFKIGIFGLGIQLDGVVPRHLYGDVQYRDPVIWAEGLTRSMRNYHRCDLVICLSHLGYHYNDDRIDDVTLAQKVGGIDLIIGGHTHTFLDTPTVVQNAEGGQTCITQMGHSGVWLGRIDIDPEQWKRESRFYANKYVIGREQDQ